MSSVSPSRRAAVSGFGRLRGAASSGGERSQAVRDDRTLCSLQALHSGVTADRSRRVTAQRAVRGRLSDALPERWRPQALSPRGRGRFSTSGKRNHLHTHILVHALCIVTYWGGRASPHHRYDPRFVHILWKRRPCGGTIAGVRHLRCPHSRRSPLFVRSNF